MSGVSATAASLNGVLLGAGADWKFTSEPAGLDMQGDTPMERNPNRDGGRFVGATTLQPKVLTFEVRAVGTAEVTAALLRDLKSAWAPVRAGEVPLTLLFGGETYTILGRPNGVVPDLSDSRFGTIRARCVFEAADPRLLGEELSVSIGVPQASGLSFPVEFPVEFGAVSTGAASVFNVGNTDTPWSARLEGPLSTPTLIRAESGKFVELDTSIADGSTLEVHSSGLVLLDGSPRPGVATLLSRFFELPPGASTIRFRAQSGDGSALFIWRPAWQ